jgi:hypothetical protein
MIRRRTLTSKELRSVVRGGDEARLGLGLEVPACPFRKLRRVARSAVTLLLYTRAAAVADDRRRGP